MFTITVYLLFCLTLHTVYSQECDPFWKVNARNIFEQKNYYNSDTKKTGTNIETLRLVHVLFRHGARTADPDVFYPLDPYYNFTFYPYGRGQLTNLGKTQVYELGKTLRKRYNNFLGEIYTPELLEALSTDVNRTKVSLDLVLGGLWPPTKELLWNKDIPWLPIPFNYIQESEDILLGDSFTTCPRYNRVYTENLHSKRNREEHEELNSFFRYLSHHMGVNITKPLDVYNYYFTFKAQEEWGLKLPAWTKCVWPEKILEVTLRQYELYTQTHELTSLSIGHLLQKIISDSQLRISNNNPRKIYLYSGHERNLAILLIALGVYYPHVPPYASYVLLELHEIKGDFGFQMFYQDYSDNEPKLITIPHCGEFCPIDKFIQLLKPNLPHNSCNL